MSDIFSQQTADFRPSNKAFRIYYFEVSPKYLVASQTPILEGRDVLTLPTQPRPRPLPL
jgi:hypothetical protein